MGALGIFDRCLLGNPRNTEGCWGLWNSGKRKEKIRIRCLKTLKPGKRSAVAESSGVKNLYWESTKMEKSGRRRGLLGQGNTVDSVLKLV